MPGFLTQQSQINGITQRDVEAVQLVYDLQYVTIEQAAECLFRNRNVSQRRLAKLEDYGLLTSFPMPDSGQGRPTKVYFVNRKARRAIEALLERALDPANISTSVPQNALVAQHHIELNQVLCAFISAAATRNYSFQYIPEYRASHGHGRTTRVLDQQIRDPINRRRLVRYRRDAVCCIGTPNGKALFEVEYDRGSEVLGDSTFRKTTIARKLAIFLDSVKQKHFTRYSGRDFFHYPFHTSRLLFITNATSRLKHIAELCLSLNTYGLVYLTTVDQITASTVLGPIWVQPMNGQASVQPLIRTS